MAHGVLDLLHGWSLTWLFVPTVGHQSLYGLRQVFDKWGASTCIKGNVQSVNDPGRLYLTHTFYLTDRTKIIVMFWSIMETVIEPRDTFKCVTLLDTPIFTDRQLVSWFWLVFLTSVDSPHDTKC